MMLTYALIPLPLLRAHRQQQMELEMDIESNEHLIAQREKGIEEIERTIIEINDLFRDLGSLVHEQGYMLGMCMLCGLLVGEQGRVLGMCVLCVHFST